MRPSLFLAFLTVLLQGCTATSTAQPAGKLYPPQSGEAHSTAEAALRASVERVCLPYLAGEPTARNAETLAAAAGFHPVSREEALASIGEDYVANLEPGLGARVTLSFNMDLGSHDCGVAVIGAASEFNRFIEDLLASGWTQAGPPIRKEGERTDWIWSPEGAVTLVVTRLTEGVEVPPARVFALVLMKGQEPIPPECGPTQGPPCLHTF